MAAVKGLTEGKKTRVLSEDEIATASQRKRKELEVDLWLKLFEHILKTHSLNYLISGRHDAFQRQRSRVQIPS